jgi:hypothetical protein
MSETGAALVYESSGEIVPIGAGLVAGRGPSCSLHIPDPTVSKLHAHVLRDGGGHVVVDLGSTNGTYVNGVQVRSKGLAEGDHLRFGTVAFRFRANASSAQEARAPDRRLTRALEALRGLSTEMLALESERAVIRAASGFLLEHVQADRVFVAFTNPDGGSEGVEIALIRTRPDLDPKWSVAPVAHTPMKEAVKRRKTFCPSLDHEDFEVTAASVRAASLGSILVVPLLARGKVLGAVQAERVDGANGPFDEVDVLLGEVVANLIASSVETARLYRFAPRSRPAQEHLKR